MGFWRNVGKVFKVVFPVVYLANRKWIDGLDRKTPGAADLRANFKPRAASYGQVVPLVYGTSLVSAPAYVRGRLEVFEETWRQWQLALGLCQGPIASVRSLWLSDGSDGELAKTARVPWAKAAECGLTLQVGNLTGNSAISPAFERTADDFVVSWDGVTGDPAHAVGRLKLSAGSTRSFLPTLLGATSLELFEVQITGMGTPARLDGVYEVTSIADKEVQIVVDTTNQLHAWWAAQMSPGVEYAPWSSYVIGATAGGLCYPGIAYLRANPLDLAAMYRGVDANTATLTPSYSAEVVGLCAGAGPDGLDADAGDVLTDLFGPNYWAANVGATVEATIGAGGTADSGARRYCQASGFWISGVIDEQRTVAAHGQEILDSINCAALCSEGKIKILPLGDEPVTGNGVTYTPNTTPIYDLGVGTILARGDEPMIRMSAFDEGAACNVLPVEYRDRNAGGAAYRVAIETAFDSADIETQFLLYGGTGKREASPVVLHWITNAAHARSIAQLRLQRAMTVRNGQTFKVGWRHGRIEGMDLLTLSDPNLQLDHYTVRVAAIEEDESGEITVETIDWPLGLASATLYQTQSSDSAPPQVSEDPGAVSTPVVVAVPAALSGSQPSIWIGATGVSERYGGCDVYLSADGTAYSLVGTIEGRSKIGRLTATLATGTALDDVHDLLVDTVESRGILSATSTAGRDALETLSWVDGEVLAFRDVTPGTLDYTYTLESLRRGAYGTTIGAHSAGATFLRIDAKVLQVQIPQSMFGVPLYVKCVPFNHHRGGRTALGDVTATTVTLTLPTPVYPTTCSLAVTSTPPSAAANQWRETATENLHTRWARVQWTIGANAQLEGFDVAVYTGTDPDATQAYVESVQGLAANVRDAVFAVSAGASPLTVRAAVRARYPEGVASAWRTSASSDVIDANTSAPGASLEAANEALTLAGSKAKVFYQTTAPATGMQVNDIWFDTTSYVDSDGQTKQRFTPYRYTGSVWDPHDRSLIIASEIAAGAIVADKIAARSVTLSHLTIAPGGNMWPNPTSEAAPPSGADTATAEWAYREDVGANAYSGSWVRRLSTAGEVPLILSHTVPAMPAQRFSLSAQVRLVSGSADALTGIAMEFLNGAGDVLGFAVSGETVTGTWQKFSASGVAPAGTVGCRFLLRALDSAGFNIATVDFDAIDARSEGALRTENYEEDANGFATAGAQIDSAGTAIKAAVDGVRFGPTLFSDLWSWGYKRQSAGPATHTGSGANAALSAFSFLSEAASFVRGSVVTGGATLGLKVAQAGNYLVRWQLLISRGDGSGAFTGWLVKRPSTTAITGSYAQTWTGSTQYVPLGETFYASFAADDDVEIVLGNLTNGVSFAVSHATLSIQRLPD